MEYQIQDLLPIVAHLTDKYTSMESTSVPYETAQMIMEAVIYCLDENFSDNENGLRDDCQELDIAKLYERGYQLAVQKVHQAKQIYESIIVEFEDYGCRNYHDTIISGMPAFFINYDVRFQPQNHILTLDYPLLVRQPGLTGINLIHKYLESIQIEQQFLNCFAKESIIQFLDNLIPDYQQLYFDNLCNPVLQQAVGCYIADQPIHELVLSDSDKQLVQQFFAGDSKERRKEKIVGILRILLRQMDLDETYFQAAATEFPLFYI